MSHKQEAKIFNDPIHGHIELHPLCVKIIDTPQFQRLRFIKQLGGCYFVFPGASHNRFEHSLGVCHLAGQFARILQHGQTDLEINEEDVLCVEIAGLCHDLGHGPFSHLFDGHFIPQITKKGKKDEGGWEHEKASVEMFDHLVKENNLESEFKKSGLKAGDSTFIREMINGPLQTQRSGRAYPYKGRNREKGFLYDIVSNKRNGIDVDKWDYFARDCHMLGIRNNFDHNRLMKFSRVCKVEGDWQICFRDKEAFNLYDMFHTRSALHTRALQHKVTKVVEDMIVEAMVKADLHITIPGKDGKPTKISECVNDMVAYTNLTDEILRQILLSKDDALKPSQTIINNVLCRKLYKFVDECRRRPPQKLKKEEIEEKIRQLMQNLSDDDINVHEKMEENMRQLMQFLLDRGLIDDDINVHEKMEENMSQLKQYLLERGLTDDDIHVHMVTLDYGMKDKDPMEKVRFYKKTDPETAIEVPKHQVSFMLPERFAEHIIRVFCKDADKYPQTYEQVMTHFKEWCSDNGMECSQPISVNKRRSARIANICRSKRPRK